MKVHIKMEGVGVSIAVFADLVFCPPDARNTFGLNQY